MNVVKCILFFFLIACTACNRTKEKSEDRSLAVAKVFDEYLLKSDLKGISGNTVSKKDSAIIAQQFIKRWIEERLFYKYAIDNLEDEDLNIEKQLEDYKKALIIYKYESELIKQKMDTFISIKEMADYYLANEGSFKLRDNIVKARYVKVNKDKSDINQLNSLFKSKKPADSSALEAFCSANAYSYFLDTDKWILFDDLKKEIPLEKYDADALLKNNRFLTFSDSAYTYFLDIKAALTKNSLSPIAFELNNIRKILINKKKLDLIEKVKQEVVENANKKKEFEIYEP